MLTSLVAAAGLTATGVVSSIVPRQVVTPVWGGINITQEVFNVVDAISSPNCNATQSCVAFTTWVPTCLAVHQDPACWCANPDPLHYCAICMSSPQDNTTTPAESAAAGSGHVRYHQGCNAYFAYINGTLSSTSSSMASTSSATASATLEPATGGSKPSNTGLIAGAAVGGGIGLLLILIGGFLIYRHMQNKHEERGGRGGPHGDINRSSYYPDPADDVVKPTPMNENIISPIPYTPHSPPPFYPTASDAHGHGSMSPAPTYNPPSPAYQISPAPRESKLFQSNDYDTSMLNEFPPQPPSPPSMSFKKNPELM